MIYEEPMADVSFFDQIVGKSWESEIDPDNL